MIRLTSDKFSYLHFYALTITLSIMLLFFTSVAEAGGAVDAPLLLSISEDEIIQYLFDEKLDAILARMETMLGRMAEIVTHQDITTIAQRGFDILSTLKQASGGAYHPGHYGSVDKAVKDGQGNVLFEAGLTHSPGSTQNPSHKIHSTKDLQGPHSKGQNATFVKPPIFVPETYFDSTLVLYFYTIREWSNILGKCY